MAALQEGVVHLRLHSTLRSRVLLGQSGYIRDVADVHLLLHKIVSIRIQLGLCTHQVPGDVAKAFPRACRIDFLLAQCDYAGVGYGMWALNASIHEWDDVQATLGGISVVRVSVGVPEGSVMGPLGFPMWFDSLTRQLRDTGHGVRVCVEVPEPCKGRCWQGGGAPVPELVVSLAERIRSGGEVPTCAELDDCQHLEASALAALDRLSVIRAALVLHADDPVVLASTLRGSRVP